MRALKRLVSFIIILVFTAALAYSQQSPSQQDQKKISFTINGGVAIPVAPFFFRENWNVGPGIEAGIGYRINSNTLVQLNGSYHNFGFNSNDFRSFQNLPTGSTVTSSNAETMTLGLNVIIEYRIMETELIPYLKVGSGLFRFLPRNVEYSTADEVKTFDSESETSLMVNSGIGFLYALRRNVSAFLEAKLATGLFVERRTQYLPISFGIRF